MDLTDSASRLMKLLPSAWSQSRSSGVLTSTPRNASERTLQVMNGLRDPGDETGKPGKDAGAATVEPATPASALSGMVEESKSSLSVVTKRRSGPGTAPNLTSNFEKAKLGYANTRLLRRY